MEIANGVPGLSHAAFVSVVDLDVVLVDNETRGQIGRPRLTISTDANMRVLGNELQTVMSAHNMVPADLV